MNVSVRVGPKFNESCLALLWLLAVDDLGGVLVASANEVPVLFGQEFWNFFLTLCHEDASDIDRLYCTAFSYAQRDFQSVNQSKC